MSRFPCPDQTHRHYLSHLFLPADLTACETRARKTAFATEPFSPDGLSRERNTPNCEDAIGSIKKAQPPGHAQNINCVEAQKSAYPQSAESLLPCPFGKNIVLFVFDKRLE